MRSSSGLAFAEFAIFGRNFVHKSRPAYQQKIEYGPKDLDRRLAAAPQQQVLTNPESLNFARNVVSL
jgi:hypothetical protein